MHVSNVKIFDDEGDSQSVVETREEAFQKHGRRNKHDGYETRLYICLLMLFHSSECCKINKDSF